MPITASRDDIGGKPAVAIRAFLPFAERAWVHPAAAVEMARLENTDFFEAQFPGSREPFRYEIRMLDKDGHERQFRDPEPCEEIL